MDNLSFEFHDGSGPKADYIVRVFPNPRANAWLGGDHWQTVTQIKYEYCGDSGLSVLVPNGFLVDRDKLPWALRTFAPIWGAAGGASVMYQFMKESKFATRGFNNSRVTRREIHTAVRARIRDTKSIALWKRALIAIQLGFLGLRKHYDVTVSLKKLYLELEWETKKQLQGTAVK